MAATINRRETSVETLNGFTIIGEFYESPRERVIIGYRNVDIPASGTHYTEWVTARALPRGESSEWYWGDYYSSEDSAENKRRAILSFTGRSGLGPAVVDDMRARGETR